MSSSSSSSPTTVAVLGSAGSFTSIAASRFFVRDVSLVHCSSFDAIFDAMSLTSSSSCSFGVLPVENSDLGTIRLGIDMLVQKPEYHIVGEIYQRESLCLCTRPSLKRIEDISAVRSHQVALDQCSEYLKQLRSVVEKDGVQKLRRVATSDTVSACEDICRQDDFENDAAIASREAAEANGLKVLAKDIANDLNNETRFLVIGKTPKVPRVSTNTKTSLVFSFEKDEPGLLFKAISCFALRDINILQVGMRPAAAAGQLMRMKPHWTYITLMDIEGTLQEENIANAVNHLKEMTSALRVLGSYERGVNRRLEAKRRGGIGSKILCEVGGM